MIVTSIGNFIDDTLNLVNLAFNGEEIEILMKKGDNFKSLQLKLKNNDEQDYT